MTEAELQEILGAYVEQARALATRLAGDPEQLTVCHFCGGPLPLWENLLVTQLAGVAAHVQCPDELLCERLNEVGPDEAFPYDDFCQAVRRRMKDDPVDQAAGTIDI